MYAPLLPRRYPYWVASIAAALLTLGGVGLLIGWHAGLLPQQGYLRELVALKSHAIVALTMAGLSLWLQIDAAAIATAGVHRTSTALARALAMGVIGLGLLSLTKIAFAIDTIIDPILSALWLGSYSLGNNAMSLLSAICFILAGASLLLLDLKIFGKRYPAEYLALLAAAFMCIPLVGYLFSASPLIEFALAPQIAKQSPLPFLILAVGILFARPKHPLMAVFFSDAPGGKLLRSVLPMTLMLLLVPDLLAHWGARQGYYDSELISPLVVLIGGGLLLLLFWRAAIKLNQEYGGRVKGEAALAKTNELIRIVSDFTTDAIHVKDHKGRLIFANPAALKLLNRSLVSAIGRTSQELFPDPAIAAVIEGNNRAVLDSGSAQAVEVTFEVEDSPRTFYSTTAPWFGEGGEVLGTVGIASDITDRKRAEDALKAHELQLEALVEARTVEVRELIGHLQTLREEEKRAIARELHDDLGSSLTALNMHLAILFQQICVEPSIAERTAQIKTLLSSVTATTRRIQNGLRPDKLDIFGIKTAITEQAHDFQNYTGVTCNASLPDEEIKYSTEVEISLFRMVQEALNNIAKHAKASQVDIILDDDEDSLYLTIRDNGVGIGPNAPPYNSSHGLRGMRERAAYLGGRIEILSSQGAGTRIKVILPKQATPITETIETLRASA